MLSVDQSSIVMRKVPEKELHAILKESSKPQKHSIDSHFFFIFHQEKQIGGAAISKKEEAACSLNYWLEYEYLTSGYSTLIASELIDYAMKHLHIHTMTSNCIEPLWGNAPEPFSAK